MTMTNETIYRPSGTELILTERRRQIDAEGWSLDHDREHGPNRLAQAARFYEMHGIGMVWPFDSGRGAKVKGPLRNLVRAGALYQAAADVAPEIAQAPWDRASYEAASDRCADAIDALIAEVMEALGGV